MPAFGDAIFRVSPRLHDTLCAVRDGAFEGFPPRRIFADPALHAACRRIFSGRRGFFVEAGANDGLRRSNTHYLERRWGWTGILIEAIPHRAVDCRRNRPASETVHCALVGPDYRQPLVEMVYLDPMSIVASGAGALDVDQQIERYRRYGHRRDVADGMVFHAPARTLDSVLADAGYPEIDLLSLDVEGSELDVLQGLDFARARPEYILIEDWDRSGVDALLTRAGYRLQERPTERDAIYRASRPCPALPQTA